jgi:hypothetical protein
MPKRKRIKGSRTRVREVMNECAMYARQLPKGERLRAYRKCIAEKLKGLQ